MFRCHGRPRAVSLNGGTTGEGQWKVAVVIDPIPVPCSPRPPLSVPDMRAELQVSTESVVVSFSVVFPAVAVMAPPGRTLQATALAAADDTAPAPTATAIPATARLPIRIRIQLPIRIRIQEPPPDRCACVHHNPGPPPWASPPTGKPPPRQAHHRRAAPSWPPPAATPATGKPHPSRPRPAAPPATGKPHPPASAPTPRHRHADPARGAGNVVQI